jgi:hypothetical protein
MNDPKQQSADSKQQPTLTVITQDNQQDNQPPTDGDLTTAESRGGRSGYGVDTSDDNAEEREIKKASRAKIATGASAFNSLLSKPSSRRLSFRKSPTPVPLPLVPPVPGFRTDDDERSFLDGFNQGDNSFFNAVGEQAKRDVDREDKVYDNFGRMARGLRMRDNFQAAKSIQATDQAKPVKKSALGLSSMIKQSRASRFIAAGAGGYPLKVC